MKWLLLDEDSQQLKNFSFLFLHSKKFFNDNLLLNFFNILYHWKAMDRIDSNNKCKDKKEAPEF